MEDGIRTLDTAPVWETQMKSQVPGSGLASPGCFGHLQDETVDGNISVSPSPSLGNFTFQINLKEQLSSLKGLAVISLSLLISSKFR